MDDSSELEELRSRISQLENLVVSKTLEVSFNSSLPNTTVYNLEILVERVGHLETLLAASELENRKLNEEIVLLNTAIKRQHAEREEQLLAKSRELVDLKYETDLQRKKNENYERKLKNMETYINTLPSEEELTEAQAKIKKLDTQVYDLQKKVERTDSRSKLLQRELFDKEKQYQGVALKLEELQPLEEAQETFLSDERLERLNFSDKEEVRKIIIVLKAELVRSKQIISSYRKKMTHIEENKAQCTARIECLSLLLAESQEQFLGVSTENDELKKQLETMNLKHQELNSLFNELQSRTEQVLKTRELRQDQYESVIRLVSEIDFCVDELNNSIQLGQKLLRNEEPDVDLIIGLSDFDFHVDSITSSERTPNSEDSQNARFSTYLQENLGKLSLEGDLDLEWCLGKWETVRTSRKELAALRSQLGDIYAQKLGGNCDGCPVQ